MYTHKNLISLGFHDDVAIYLDLCHGDLKQQTVNRTGFEGKVFLATMIGLQIVQFGIFNFVFSNSFLNVLFFLTSVLASILLAIILNKNIYKNIILEPVLFSQAEYEAFKKRLKKYDLGVLWLTIIVVLVIVFGSIFYFIYPSIILLIAIDLSVFSVYFLFTNGFLTKRRHFEQFLNPSYTNKKG
ncbi:hypothetical protein ACVRXQ_13025 [Streptococcus panodentis]|uniref:DUF443 family protein n=1 Tax=Streptococcus panodentis TaxID=1581472 RepID=A0ABS5B056_9STRE|nr:hypothetical protein [Streptococcus panodentis]MBP2622214.1 hypothetical protein [Streptococcus panodentis]